MNLTITIEIPALDRLCNLFETQTLKTVVDVIEEEIRKKLGAAPAPAPEPVPAPEPEPVPGPAPVPAPKAVAERPTGGRAEPASAGAQRQDAGETRGQGSEASCAGRGAVTLEAVQRAAGELKYAGKLDAVTGMFGDFGIKKLSDLKGDALQAFADRLRDLGARI